MYHEYEKVLLQKKYTTQFTALAFLKIDHEVYDFSIYR
jgi:hypothetical protein